MRTLRYANSGPSAMNSSETLRWSSELKGLVGRLSRRCRVRAPVAFRAGGDDGFTLVEVIAAMAIFVLVSTATVSILILALRTVRENSDRVRAANIAQSQVDQLRFLGAELIPEGLSLGGPIGTDPAFTVRTTANWVGLSQSVSACVAAQPGQSYVRVHVEVSSANLTGPQVIDTVVVPDSGATSDGTGGATVAVVDQLGAPVSDVAVRGLDAMKPTNAFTLTTGTDGCLFLPGLAPTGSLLVSVSRSGFVSSTPTGTAQTLLVTAGSVTRSTFELAEQSSISFASSVETHPLPPLIPVSWQVNTTGAAVTTATAGAAVSSLWPNTNGFSAWAGSCTDANPTGYGVAHQSFAFIAGQTTTAALAVAPVKLRGLPADAPVTALYAGNDPACAGQSFAIGRSDAVGVLRAALPYGNWRFQTPGQAQALLAPLIPPLEATPPAEVIVNFTLAELDNPTPAPSPSGTATSATPDPTATATGGAP